MNQVVVDGVAEAVNHNRGYQQRHGKIKILFQKSGMPSTLRGNSNLAGRHGSLSGGGGLFSIHGNRTGSEAVCATKSSYSGVTALHHSPTRVSGGNAQETSGRCAAFHAATDESAVIARRILLTRIRCWMQHCVLFWIKNTFSSSTTENVADQAPTLERTHYTLSKRIHGGCECCLN